MTTASPSPSSSSAARPVNHYIRRLAGTPKACMVCLRPSPHVLVSQSLPASDFFYVCESHLSDRHFASRIQQAAQGTAAGAGAGTARLPDKVGQEEIDKIKKEYEERERKKKEDKEAKEKEKKESAGDEKGKDEEKKKGEEKGKSWFAGLSSMLDSVVPKDEPSSSASPSSATSTAVKASPAAAGTTTTGGGGGGGQHERYQLQRDFYAMRLEAHKKAEALRRARELNLPHAPKGEVRPARPAAAP